MPGCFEHILEFVGEEHSPRQVDLLVAKTPFEEAALERRQIIALGSLGVPVLSPEDLVVYKLLADRARDREDIRVVLRTQARAGRFFDWAYVEHWAAFWRVADRLAALRREFP